MNKRTIRNAVLAFLVLSFTTVAIQAEPNTQVSPLPTPGTFDSPLPTPPLPPPPPTPSPSAEAQAALAFLAQREGIPASSLVVATDHRTEYPNLGRQFQVVTLLDTRPQGRFYNLLVDRSTGAVIEDVASLWRAEERARTEKYGKLQPALYERLRTMQDTDVVTVTILVAAGPGQSLPEREVAARAALAAKYPEARAAVERGGLPMDVDDRTLADRIYKEYVELVEGGATPRVQPLVEALRAQGITTRTSEGLPAVTASPTKKDILLLAQRGDVGTIYLAEGGKYSLSLDTAIPTDRAPALGNSLQELVVPALLGVLALEFVAAFQVVKASRRKRGGAMKRLVKVTGSLLLGLLVLVLILIARPLLQPMLPFETIAKYGEQPDYGFGLAYREEKPGLIVIAKSEEIDSLAQNVLAGRSDLVDRLRQLDYNHYFAILVLHGYIGSDCCRVNVQRISQEGDQVIVWAEFVMPALGARVNNIFTSPYHLVAVPKEGHWGKQVQFVLMKGFELVAGTTHFIP